MILKLESVKVSERLDAQVEASDDLLDRMFAHCKRPVLMCSFGKDSMVLLHLLHWRCKRDGAPMLPVLFHREPFFPEKYAFSNGVIEDWGLSVYDYPACATALAGQNTEASSQKSEGKRNFEVLNFYQVGRSQGVVPTGIDPDSEERINCGERFLCGRDDLLKKPLGTFDFPWDGVLVGHKSSDKDPMWGDLHLHVDVRQMPGGADWYFPLRHWTDDDIWEYTEAFGVPVHRLRYEKVDGVWGERADKKLNPDYFPACMRCLDRQGPVVVRCPKLDLEVTNISAQVRHVDLRELEYFGHPNSEVRSQK